MSDIVGVGRLLVTEVVGGRRSNGKNWTSENPLAKPEDVNNNNKNNDNNPGTAVSSIRHAFYCSPVREAAKHSAGHSLKKGAAKKGPSFCQQGPTFLRTLRYLKTWKRFRKAAQKG
jgi:hypothetical protein